MSYGYFGLSKDVIYLKNLLYSYNLNLYAIYATETKHNFSRQKMRFAAGNLSIQTCPQQLSLRNR